MALDLQRNWDVSMEENLRHVKQKAAAAKLSSSSTVPVSHSMLRSYIGRPVYLPDEIILQILSYIRHFAESQKSLYACTLLSRQWYQVGIPILYDRPFLEGNNIDPFIKTICPSINLHVRKSTIAELVRVMDLSRMVHQASKSVTARLLGRTKDNLLEFVAPQASFALNSFPALSKCKTLRKLDLSLVSEIGSLEKLFKTVSGLTQLTELRLPRSSGFGNNIKSHEIEWPPTLEKLFLSGSLDANFMYGMVRLPQTLRELTIEHCPLAKGAAIRHLLGTIAAEQIPLQYLKLSHMPRLSETALDSTLMLLPQVETLSVSVDYVSPNLLDTDFNNFGPGALKLRVLELTNSGYPGVEDKFSPLDIMITMDEGAMPQLRQVRVVKSLGWRHPNASEDFDALDDVLKSAALRHDTEFGVSEEVAAIRPGAWELTYG